MANKKKKWNQRKTSATFQKKSRQLAIREDGLNRPKYIVFGFKHMDTSQGQNFEGWESEELLSKAMNRLRGISSMTLPEALQQGIIKIYGTKIPEHSAFVQPKHLLESTEWQLLELKDKKELLDLLKIITSFKLFF